MSTKSNTAKAEKVEKSKPIHHATMNRAIENDVKLEEVKDGKFRAVHKDGKKATAESAKEALDKVIRLVNPPEGDEEGEEEGSGLVIVKEKYKKKYQPNGGNNGDKLAKALTTFRATGEKAFVSVCRENKIAPETWNKVKNAGLRWMPLSNVLRARIKRKEEVTVNGVKITEL